MIEAADDGEPTFVRIDPHPVGLLPMTVMEGDVLRSAFLEQVRAHAQFVLDNANSPTMEQGAGRWSSEDDLSSDAADLAILCAQLAILGRSIDDEMERRRGTLPTYDNDGNELDVTVIPVAEFKMLLAKVTDDEELTSRLKAYIEQAEDHAN